MKPMLGCDCGDDDVAMFGVDVVMFGVDVVDVVDDDNNGVVMFGDFAVAGLDKIVIFLVSDGISGGVCGNRYTMLLFLICNCHLYNSKVFVE